MNENKRLARLCDAGLYRQCAAGSALNQHGIQALKRLARLTGLASGHCDNDLAAQRVCGKCVRCPAQQGLSRHPLELLGHAASRPCTAACGNDACTEWRHRVSFVQHSGTKTVQSAVLSLAVRVHTLYLHRYDKGVT